MTLLCLVLGPIGILYQPPPTPPCSAPTCSKLKAERELVAIRHVDQTGLDKLIIFRVFFFV